MTTSASAQTAAGGQAASGRAPMPATQTEQAEARDRYSRAIQLFNEAHYDMALIEMQRAYSLNPSYRILYNLAQIQIHLGDAAAALGNLERYLSDGGADVPAPRAAEVNQEIAKLRPRVGTVELIVKEGGAEVLLDDTVIGRSPFRKSVLVNVGKHRFGASKTGTAPVSRVVAVAGMDNLALELDLSTPTPSRVSDASASSSVQGAETSPTKTGPTREDSMRPSNSRAWIGWIATGTLAAGAIATGIVTQVTANELGDLRDTPRTSRSELDSKAATAQRMAILTDVLLGATAVAGAVAIYYTLSSRSSSESLSASTRVQLGATPGGILVRGSF